MSSFSIWNALYTLLVCIPYMNYEYYINYIYAYIYIIYIHIYNIYIYSNSNLHAYPAHAVTTELFDQKIYRSTGSINHEAQVITSWLQ